MATDGLDGDLFKRCTLCERIWSSRELFLADPEVSVVGYQAFTEEVSRGLFLFNHLSCGTTLALGVGEFQDLHEGVIYSQRMTGTPRCPQHCFEVKDTEPCPNPCSGAWVRDLLQRLVRWPKQPRPADVERGRI